MWFKLVPGYNCYKLAAILIKWNFTRLSFMLRSVTFKSRIHLSWHLGYIIIIPNQNEYQYHLVSNCSCIRCVAYMVPPVYHGIHAVLLVTNSPTFTFEILLSKRNLFPIQSKSDRNK